MGLIPEVSGAIAQVLEGNPAERVLDRLLRSLPGLNHAQRRAIAEAVFGVGLWRRRLKAELGLKAPSSAQLLASLLRDLARVNSVEVIFDWPLGTLPKATEPLTSLADKYSLPDWLAQVLQEEVGAEAEALADALNVPGPVCIRANAARITRESLARQLCALDVETQPARYAPYGLIITSPRPNIYGLAPFQEGLFEVQDEGSQLLVDVVSAQPGEEILDFCAGAGGKSLALAAQVGPRGRVHAFDINLPALERLRQRAERAQLSNIVIHQRLPAEKNFDAVLVDAPCSELGSLRRGPDKRFLIDPTTLTTWPEKQLAILNQAATLVRPLGRLVYATCTFSQHENEEVARTFEAAHRAFVRQRPPLDAALLTPEGFLRSYPHRHDTDGFFAASWVKDGPSSK